MFVSKIKKALRLEKCRSCKYKRGDFSLFGIVIFKRVKQCKLCKCSINAKASLKLGSCPLNKW